MATNIYPAISLTGGGSGALDSIDGASLNNGDIAIVITSSGYLYSYWLNSTSGASEDSPQTIAPDSNAGNKRWILNNMVFIGGIIDKVSTAPTTLADQVALYVKDLAANPTLYMREESNGDEIPVGNAGLLSTTNRNLRFAWLIIESVGNATDINVYLEDLENGDDVDSAGTPHVISKGDDDTDWAFGAGGDELTCKNGAITGTHVMNFPLLTYNDGGTAITLESDDDTGIYIAFYNATTGAGVDLAGLAAGKLLDILVMYITDG